MSKTFDQILKEKIVVFDGAMGTNIQNQNLSADDFGGEHFNGCNEYLLVTKPDAIERVHSEFLSVGVDVIETDTFGSSSIVLAEYGIQDRAYEISKRGAEIAKKVAREFSTAAHPRFVAGSIGPTTKLPSLGHITFAEMERSYYEQVAGLVEGGSDLLIVETSQDLLQVKAALGAAFRYFADKRINCPS